MTTAGVPVHRCDTCGNTVFPEPVWCFECGGNQWTVVEVFDGVVEESTTVLHADGDFPMATVRIDDNLAVIAAAPNGITPGTAVRLSYEDGQLRAS